MNLAFETGVRDKIAASNAMTREEKSKAMQYGLAGAGAAGLAGLGFASAGAPSQIQWDPAMADKMMRHMKIRNVVIGRTPYPQGAAMTLAGNKWVVRVPRQGAAESLAHELGHVSRRKPSHGRFVLDVKGTRQFLPFVGGVGGAILAAKGRRGGWETRLAPALALAGNAPMLYDEARASVRGYKALKALGTLSPAELKTVRNKLIHSLGTYGAAALMAAAPAAAIAAVKWKKRDGEKRAS